MKKTFTSNGIKIEYESDTEGILEALENAVYRGLAAVGETAVGYAQEKCPVQTGNLAGSITYQVDGNDCYIGTNVEYAPYVEFGTGVFAEEGGRDTPWSYQDAHGNWYTTVGQKPQPFLRPATAEHGKEYKGILKSSMENA